MPLVYYTGLVSKSLYGLFLLLISYVSVKNSSSTMVPNLKGFSILRIFS